MEKAVIIKGVTTTSASVGFASFFALTQEAQTGIEILTYLIMIDFFTGLIKSWINKITSSDGILRGFIKKGIIIIIPLTISLLGQGVDIDMTTFLIWSTGALCFGEAYSILGNCYTITTGKKVKEYDVISILIKKLGEIIDAFLDIFIGKK